MMKFIKGLFIDEERAKFREGIEAINNAIEYLREMKNNPNPEPKPITYPDNVILELEEKKKKIQETQQRNLESAKEYYGEIDNYLKERNQMIEEIKNQEINMSNEEILKELLKEVKILRRDVDAIGKAVWDAMLPTVGSHIASTNNWVVETLKRTYQLEKRLMRIEEDTEVIRKDVRSIYIRV